jgi:FkbM family methyltransferase
VRFSAAKRLGLWVVARRIPIPEGPGNRYQEMLHLTRLLERQAVNCVIDVGATRGQFALELRGAGYDGPIWSFEPVAAPFAELEQTFAGDGRWHGRRLALGAAAAETEINVVAAATEMSSLHPLVGDWGTIEREVVRVRRLDAVFEEITAETARPRVFLKIDTQGHDLEVFRGAAGCLDAIVALQSELSVVAQYDGSPSYLDALAEFRERGFELINLATVSRRTDGDLLELNALLRRVVRVPASGGP